MESLTVDLKLQSNALTSTIPTELGQLAIETGFDLSSSTLSLPIPTELGALGDTLTEWFDLSANTLSYIIPTELGSLTLLTKGFLLSDNFVCEEVPTQVGALSDLVTSDYAVTTGNEIGTVCRGGSDFPSAVPTPGPTIVCEGGQYYDHYENLCVDCHLGRYVPQQANDTAYAPWPSECPLCPVGKINQDTGMTFCGEPGGASRRGFAAPVPGGRAHCA